MNNNNIIYFELNNWNKGWDYPDCEPFISWLQDDGNQKFQDDEWCKSNELCVAFEFVDMSQNYKITATRNWVKENCPALLDKNNAEFVCNLDTTEYSAGALEYYKYFRCGSAPFLKWCETNFGYHQY